MLEINNGSSLEAQDAKEMDNGWNQHQHPCAGTQKELRQILPDGMWQDKPWIIDKIIFDDIYWDEDKITDFLRTKCFHMVPWVDVPWGLEGKWTQFSIIFPVLPWVKLFEKPRKFEWLVSKRFVEWTEYYDNGKWIKFSSSIEDMEAKVLELIREFKKALWVSQDENMKFVSELSYKRWRGQDKPWIIDKIIFDEIYWDEDKITNFLRTKCFHMVPLVTEYWEIWTHCSIIFPGLPWIKWFEKPRKLEWFVSKRPVEWTEYRDNEEWRKNSSSVEDIATKVLEVIREFKKALWVSQDENMNFASKLSYREWQADLDLIDEEDITCETSRTFWKIIPGNEYIGYHLKNGGTWNVREGNFYYDDDETWFNQLFLGLSEQM